MMAQHFPVLRHVRANNPGDLLGPRSSLNVCVEFIELIARDFVVSVQNCSQSYFPALNLGPLFPL
jgi:hypothetical protein